MKLRTLIQLWEQLNASVFSGLLYPPAFYRTRSRGEYASYVAGIIGNSELYFNTDHIKGDIAKSVVYHEMVHQYLEEVLNVEEKNHHGPLFWHYYKAMRPTNVVLFSELD